MRDYPAKPTKRKPKKAADKFDKSQLTSVDHALLDAFKERRAYFDRELRESTILFHKKTCPGCGYPTFEDDNLFTSCPICLWEGYVAGKNDTYIGPPNYISLIEHRLNISRMLQLFQERYRIDHTLEKIIASIRHFEQSDREIDRDHFEENLRHILPTTPKLP